MQFLIGVACVAAILYYFYLLFRFLDRRDERRGKRRK